MGACPAGHEATQSEGSVTKEPLTCIIRVRVRVRASPRLTLTLAIALTLTLTLSR